ncbi:MAG: ribosome biogenesis GTPase Der [Bdellovibrionales bacterium]|nr:ribosome biogenesis GTPase Der [Bdellovibrionales bacterium]
MPSAPPNRVALLGRPNVGKSTLFNKLTRSRKAVVKNEPGVTRDILIEPAHWWGREFDVVDTGGVTESREGFSPLIREQTLRTLKSVELIIAIFDGRAGLVPEDRDIIRIAKESGKKMLLVVNKVDQSNHADFLLSEFYEFGQNIIPAAFEQDFSVDTIVEWILTNLPEEQASVRRGPCLSIIGKPNVGKSSLCNLILGENRMLVSPQVGTTVDAVEAEFSYEGHSYRLMDTAGLRRQARRNDGIEWLSAVKSQEAIRRADIILLVIDSVLGPSRQDAKMLEYCLEQHKTPLIIANKYDLGKKTKPQFKQWFQEQIRKEFHFFPDVRVCFVSALTGFGKHQMFVEIESIAQALLKKISTSQLNKFFSSVIRQAPAPVYGTVNVKFYYLTQTHQAPPSFIAFANHPEGVTPSYRRFLTKKIQEQWDLKGIPLRLFVMPSKKSSPSLGSSS